MRLILASGSPRRKEILSKNGFSFDIVKAEGEEISTQTKPGAIVMELSTNKAKEVASKVLDQDACILAADTIVYADGRVLGKPSDRQDAANMIKAIQGSVHSVFTGVTILTRNGDKDILDTFFEETKVYVKSMQEAEILEYVATGECDDKAGAYAIQGIFGKYIDHFEGDYSNVVGLPEEAVVTRLKRIL